MADPLYVAKGGDTVLALLPQMANRHGLVTGATGTGKTVTLQSLSERLSYIGVPVFLADVKGDLSGMAAAGTLTPGLQKRLDQLGLQDFTPYPNSVAFWDVFGAMGHPVRATVSDMGPLLLARLLNLNDTQAGVLQIVFRVADDEGLLLLDMKDLRAMVQHVGDNAADYKTRYGNVSPASIGAIQRGLLGLEDEGAEHFFGEPMLDVADLMRTDDYGRGVINIMAAEKLHQSPRLYSTFLLWLLSELFERLPEVGDMEKPKLVFFFDEAHLLFSEAPPALLQKVEQVVRLIRSKGVGVYFVTQNPRDVPDNVLGQLGNRVQHALRAFTPRDQKAVQSAAQTMRANPAFDAASAILELGTGEALVSFLDEKGRPSMVERAFIYPPASRLGPLTAEERAAHVRSDGLYGRYEQMVDRESAYEKLSAQSAAPAAAPEPDAAAADAEPAAQGGVLGGLGDLLGRGGARRGREGVLEAAAKSAARSIGSAVGKQILRGIMGSILGGRR
ncbi:MAG: DUF853 family protein [Rhodocyclaceae bacterium]|nr:DUF853 family protein [Rhodocyclaceae bacterium]